MDFHSVQAGGGEEGALGVDETLLEVPREPSVFHGSKETASWTDNKKLCILLLQKIYTSQYNRALQHRFLSFIRRPVRGRKYYNPLAYVI